MLPGFSDNLPQWNQHHLCQTGTSILQQILPKQCWKTINQRMDKNRRLKPLCPRSSKTSLRPPESSLSVGIMCSQELAKHTTRKTRPLDLATHTFHPIHPRQWFSREHKLWSGQPTTGKVKNHLACLSHCTTYVSAEEHKGNADRNTPIQC